MKKFEYFITAILFFCVYNLLMVSHVQAQTKLEFNYAEALQKSIFFYETQRSGDLPEDNRVNWRGDSGLNDGADNNVDLTGGWYDAGDNIKFTFPMASSATLLSWGVLEYTDAFKESGQYNYILDNIKWATDYFIKSHTSENELYVQVGQGRVDHKYWAPVEVSENLTGSRLSFKVDPSCPGSDVAGEVAASLASASLVFKETNPSYSKELLTHAEQLFNFAETYKGKYSDCIVNQDFDKLYYKSWSGYDDELAWAASWLYKATDNQNYLNKAKSYHKDNVNNDDFTHNWDDKSYGTHVLLAQLTEEDTYINSTEKWLDFWTTGQEDGKRVTYTPDGLAWLIEWGSLRYSANTSFISFIYSDWLKENNVNSNKATIYHDFSVSQINYILGDNTNDRSYIVGFGKNPPLNVHHRTAHSSPVGNGETPENNRHIIYGALVGGPDKNDVYVEDRSDYVKNEIAVDYNAGLVGALARMYKEFGGEPLNNFPEPEEKEDAFYVEAKVEKENEDRTVVSSYLYNASGWPARSSDDLSYRFYFSSDSDDISISEYYSECSSISLVEYEENKFYVEVSCKGINLYPGNSNYRKFVQFVIKNASSDDLIQNGSFLDLISTDYIKSSNITVYNGDIIVYGQNPLSEGTEDTNDPSTPSEFNKSTQEKLEEFTLNSEKTAESRDESKSVKPSSYKIKKLALEEPVYQDRTFEFKEIPDELKNKNFIFGKNDDKDFKGSEYLSFKLNEDTDIYVAYHDNVDTLPRWLNSWNKTDLLVKANHADYIVFKKYFNKGTVVLSGNSAPPMDGSHNNYFVIFN